MITTRHIDFTTSTPTETITQIPQPEIDNRQPRPFECPNCQAQCFGKFEPFEHMGISRWCSACGYTEYSDLEAYQRYCDSEEFIERERLDNKLRETKRKRIINIIGKSLEEVDL